MNKADFFKSGHCAAWAGHSARMNVISRARVLIEYFSYRRIIYLCSLVHSAARNARIWQIKQDRFDSFMNRRAAS